MAESNNKLVLLAALGANLGIAVAKVVAAAVCVLIIAAVGLFLAHWTGTPPWDGAASIVIGAALAIVAFMLARESKGLLIGERADPRMVDAIRAAFDARPEVTAVQEVITI